MNPQEPESTFARTLREGQERYDRQEALDALDRIARNQETPWRPLPPPAPAPDNSSTVMLCVTALLVILIWAFVVCRKPKKQS